MTTESITRFKRGTAECQVRLSDLVIHDIRSYTLFLPGKRWVVATARFHEDLGLLLAAARAGLDLPAEFFVPNLWGTATKLPPGEHEQMFDMLLLGHDLAAGLGYKRVYETCDSVRNGVGGTVYVR